MATNRGGQTVEVVDITPDVARTWLERRPAHQRRITFTWAAKLAEQMKDGTFEPTGDTFRFDTNGHLIDGQHRCLAIAESGVTLKGALVVKGVNPEAFGKIDIHRRRTPSQFVEGSYTGIRSGAARLFLMYEKDPELLNIRQLGASFDVGAVVKAEEAHPNIEKLAPDIAVIANATRISGAILLMVTAYGTERGETLLHDWLVGLETGANLDADDPRLAMRRLWALNHKVLNRAVEQRRSFGLIVKAWNAYVTDEPISRLQFRINRQGGVPNDASRGGEPMPQILQPE